MIKRLVWFGIGAGSGIGGSLYLQRRVRRAVDRFTPPQVVESLQQSVRRLGDDVRDAVTEGRRAVAERLEAGHLTRR